jgi:hypothetical protein
LESAIHRGNVPRDVERLFIRSEYPLLLHVNVQNYGRPGFTTNCTHCTIATARAFEANMPMSATPTPPRPRAVVSDALGGQWVRAANYNQVIRWMRIAGPGAAGVVQISRTGRRTGHVFQVVHDHNGIVFLDGQTGRLGLLEPDFKEIHFLRYK